MDFNQIKRLLNHSFKCQLDKNIPDHRKIIPYLRASVGVGKTTVVNQTAKEMGGFCYTLILAQYDVAELAGIVALDDTRTRANRLMPDWLADVHEKAKENEFVCILLDEFAQAVVANQNVASQILLERRVGQHRLPENVVLACCGNRISDRAGVNSIPTHVRDRLTFIDMTANLDQFTDYCFKTGIDPIIPSWVKARPSMIAQFDRDADANTSLRSVEKMDTVLSWKLPPLEETEVLDGVIGKNGRVDFWGYRELYQKMPEFDTINNNPTTATIPEDMNILYATMSLIATKMNKANGKNLLAYLDRIPNKEFVVYCFKSAFSRDKTLMSEQFVQSVFRTDGVLNDMLKDLKEMK